MKIGIVGYGFVGKAVHRGLEVKSSQAKDRQVQDLEFLIHDPYNDEAKYSLKEVSKEAHITFICVPTPTDFKNGKQDTSIVEQVVCDLQDTDSLLIIKSTVRPGTTKRLQETYDVPLIFNPEFLVEKTAFQDFLNQDRIVLGGKEEWVNGASWFYRKLWPEARYFSMTETEAELVKYAANAFLSTKVAFWNEIFFLASALGASYTDIANAACSDERIGTWGSQVPGPDGQYGFGGKCFPKDLITLLDLGREFCVPNFVQRGTWQTNEAVREEQDWYDIKGASTENLHGQEDLDG